MTKLCQEKIPHFNAPIYLQNKTQIGKVDEIFGPINESVSVYSRFLSLSLSLSLCLLLCLLIVKPLIPFVQLFSIKMMEGIVATSYTEGDKFYINPLKLMPLAKFLPQPK